MSNDFLKIEIDPVLVRIFGNLCCEIIFLLSLAQAIYSKQNFEIYIHSLYEQISRVLSTDTVSHQYVAHQSGEINRISLCNHRVEYKLT